ncbi:helix-turn-helix transcriptional regulator [Catellatospora sp. NPDC049111]|uniref:helix-turn-helix domain-containing protein n=1 Tax=Catellatospora sp. NPDC049111 TaxID=3155271 RepID=UPI00340170E0
MLSERDLEAAEAAAAARDYGTVLRIHRQAHGWTLEQAAARLGYSKSQLSRMETGNRRLADVDVLRRLADALDAAPRLFGLNGPRADRRQVLGQFAGWAGLALVPVPALAEQGISAGLDDLLFGLPRSAEPVTLPELGRRITAARRDLDVCRYRELAGVLPDLVRAAAATRDARPLEQRGQASVLQAT